VTVCLLLSLCLRLSASVRLYLRVDVCLCLFWLSLSPFGCLIRLRTPFDCFCLCLYLPSFGCPYLSLSASYSLYVCLGPPFAVLCLLLAVFGCLWLCLCRSLQSVSACICPLLAFSVVSVRFWLSLLSLLRFRLLLLLGAVRHYAVCASMHVPVLVCC
jgi:hypothetical protein